MLEAVINRLRLDTAATQFPAIESCDDAHVSDEHLVAAVLEGDDSAFEEIFERYKRPMTRVVGRFFRERDDIEECVQKCFIKVYFSVRTFRGGEDKSLSAWMTRIAVNVCYDELRRRKRSGENFFAELSDDENGYLETIADGRAVSAEHSLAITELAEKVLASLEISDRIALKLVYSQDYSLDEAADAMGVSASKLKSKLFRCRNQLKMRFGYLFR